MRQLSTDANNDLIAIVHGIEGNGDGGYMGQVTTFFVLEQPVFLSLPEELDDDDVTLFRQGTVLDEKAAAANGSDYAVKK